MFTPFWVSLCLWMKMEFKGEQAELDVIVFESFHLDWQTPLNWQIRSYGTGQNSPCVLAAACFMSICWPTVYYYEITSRVLQSSQWPPSLMTWAIKASLIHTVREWGWGWYVYPHTATTAMSSVDPDFIYILQWRITLSVTAEDHFVSLWDWLEGGTYSMKHINTHAAHVHKHAS